MFELTYDEIMELKYDALHGDEWAQMKLDEYYDQFEEVPEYEEPTEEEKLTAEHERIEWDTLYWIMIFENDYSGEDGRYDYPQYEF